MNLKKALKPLQDELLRRFITQPKIKPKIKEADITKLFATGKEAMLNALLIHYVDNDGFWFEWKGTNNTGGSANLTGIELVIKKANFALYAWDASSEERQKTADFYAFDAIGIDAETVIAMKFVENQPLEFWVWNKKGAKYKLTFSQWEDYVQAGIRCRFAYYWQYLYVEDAYYDDKEALSTEQKELAKSHYEATARMAKAWFGLQTNFPNENWELFGAKATRFNDGAEPLVQADVSANFLRSLSLPNDALKKAAADVAKDLYVSSAWNILGDQLAKANDMAAAIRAFTIGTQVNPGNYFSLYNLGATYIKNNELEKAIEAYQKVLSLFPEKANAWSAIGLVYLRINELELGLEAIEKARQLSPQTFSMYSAPCFYMIKGGKPLQAIPFADEAVAITKAGHAYMNRAHIYLIQNDIENAVEFYARSFDTYSDKSQYWSDYLADAILMPINNISTETYEGLIPKIKERIG